MVTKKNISDMYLHLRSTNDTIPDEALNFMRMVCLRELNKIEKDEEFKKEEIEARKAKYCRFKTIYEKDTSVVLTVYMAVGGKKYNQLSKMSDYIELPHISYDEIK